MQYDPSYHNIACFRAVVFDLDGVLVTTDELHYAAWSRISDEIGAVFNRDINDRVFRGGSRQQCMEYLLRSTDKAFTADDAERLAEKKNRYYRAMLPTLSPRDVLPGVQRVLERLKELGVRTAVASSSQNMADVLDFIGLAIAFDATVGGLEIQQSKPAPEVFIKAADKLGVMCRQCLAVEDAQTGLIAAHACGMRTMAVGYASGQPEADLSFIDLAHAFESGFFTSIKKS